MSLFADMPAVLLIERDGQATLVADRRAPGSLDTAHVDQRVRTDWYPGSAAARGPRQLAIDAALAELDVSRIHDQFGDPLRKRVVETIAALRRAKGADELAVLRACMRAGEAGHAWARAHLRAGMTELDVYTGVRSACEQAAGRPVVVYGDFAVSPGPERKGGPPTRRVLNDGDLLILDFSVVIAGYRSDFTNTLCVGGRPSDGQRRLFDACRAAMSAGEAVLRAGASCRSVYDAVRGAFAAARLAEHFPHHAGHGLGLEHPEAPYLVRDTAERLIAGDVVTLEPGLYVAGIGGIRIEHNYLITATGFERLSNHAIALC